ncbi:hypothetical protein T261_6958 [Streptomyces lydicus]|nr:hypothetical protein T261_6958 [Streptomyces lydicus]
MRARHPWSWACTGRPERGRRAGMPSEGRTPGPPGRPVAGGGPSPDRPPRIAVPPQGS